MDRTQEILSVLQRNAEPEYLQQVLTYALCLEKANINGTKTKEAKKS